MSLVAGIVIGGLIVGAGTVLALKEKNTSVQNIPTTTPQNTKFDLLDTQTGNALQNEILSNIDIISLQSQLPSRYQLVNQSPSSSNPTITIPQVFAVLVIEQDFLDLENKRNAIDQFVIFSNLV